VGSSSEDFDQVSLLGGEPWVNNLDIGLLKIF
jgi:organic radical activating enzyme